MTLEPSDPHAARAIALPGTANVRDLGSLPIAAGGHVRPGRVYRGETLAAAGAHEWCGIYDPGQAAAYRALGLRAVIELRTEAEDADDHSLWSEATGARLLRIPIQEGAQGSDTDLLGRIRSGELAGITDQVMADLYLAALDRRATDYGRVITAISDPRNQPVLVHCAAGKDRTGLVAALVLDVLGVDRELIVGDYLRTGINRPNRVDLYPHLLARLGLEREDLRPLFEPHALALEGALAHLDTAYGSSADYLLGPAGVTESRLQSLVDSLTEPGS